MFVCLFVTLKGVSGQTLTEGPVTQRGTLYDRATKEAIQGKITIDQPSGYGKPVATNRQGQYTLQLPANHQIVLAITAKGYHPVTNQYPTYAENIEKDYYLVPVPDRTLYPSNESFTLANLLFVTSSTRLMGRSFKELRQLATHLKQHPALRLTIEGHTDRVGNTEMNQALSEQRAEKIRDFLVEAGIAAERITTAGYGETRTICPPPCPDNRRVEFTITE